MSVRFICDGCGKSAEPNPPNVEPFGPPHGWWKAVTGSGMGAHACSQECFDKIKTHGVRPPATVTALKPVEGNEPWRKALAEEVMGPSGASAILGAFAGLVLGSALRKAPPSGWARPMRGERCHYFVDQDSLCGEWKGFRGAVQVKPTVSHVCETCKERHK